MGFRGRSDRFERFELGNDSGESIDLAVSLDTVQEDLFDATPGTDAPLAARMRPMNFDEFIGQEHLTAAGTAFRRAAESGKLGSFILWGPPGVGKTTLAEIVARASGAAMVKLSAVSAGVADLRKATEEARYRRRQGIATVLFIDEIHRFNKSQQDAILPVVEDGTIRLIGATTENPSFEVNSALLSRSRVYVLNALELDEIRRVVDRALASPVGVRVSVSEDGYAALANMANGDARNALNLLELAASVVEGLGGGRTIPASTGDFTGGEDLERPHASSLRSQSFPPGEGDAVVTAEVVALVVDRKNILFDKGGEQHFDLISALHKCVRDSDIDASLYWLGRMLEGGEDALYLARRLVRMATEDIGLADPRALQLAMAAQQAVHFLGMPEGALALAECTVYLAAAPKSNAVYVAYGKVRKDIMESPNAPVPLHLRNAPSGLMKELGYGKGYKYAHDHEGAKVDQQHLPAELEGRVYYEPTDRGWEARLRTT